MNILIVDDHRLVADAMKIMLQEINTDNTITACYSTQHALSIVDSGKRFDLITTDPFFQGIDGIGLLVGLRARDKDVPVFVISSSEDEKCIRCAMDHGARGFIPKTAPGSELIKGLREVLAGGKCFPKRFEVCDMQFHNSYPDSASIQNIDNKKIGRKQLQVLQLMAVGNSNKQISQIVDISEATVKYHSTKLFKMFGVRNRTSCVREAQQQGFIEAFEDSTQLVPRQHRKCSAHNRQ